MATNLLDLLTHAMENTPKQDDRWTMRTDADFHRMALLETLGFIGEVLEKSQCQQHPMQFSSQNICAVASFLQSAPELIRGMDALLDGYADMQPPARGVRHV